MAARDQVKTMASGAHSTLNGDPEVNQGRDTQYGQKIWWEFNVADWSPIPVGRF